MAEQSRPITFEEIDGHLVVSFKGKQIDPARVRATVLALQKRREFNSQVSGDLIKHNGKSLYQKILDGDEEVPLNYPADKRERLIELFSALRKN